MNKMLIIAITFIVVRVTNTKLSDERRKIL
jgi:hypothetical protein